MTRAEATPLPNETPIGAKKGMISILNPWNEIDLNIYEAHMSRVLQLQTLNHIVSQQLKDYDHTNVTILGIAGGNGLEYIDVANTDRVYVIDVNRHYLDACVDRYPELSSILKPIHCDLSDDDVVLPYANITIGNLVVEYLGEENFAKLLGKNRDRLDVLTCVIQKNNGNNVVSESGMASAFDSILAIHHDIDPSELSDNLSKEGFEQIKEIVYPLPSGKELLRIDFKRI